MTKPGARTPDAHDLPGVQAVRGGMAYGITSTGWCAPGDFISNAGPISPEIAYAMRPCGGGHRWEGFAYSSQCGCRQCGTDPQHVLECAGCAAEVREDDPQQ